MARVLSPDAKQSYSELVACDDALVAYWRFDEVTGDTAVDATGRHHGSYRHVRLGEPGAFPGDANAAARFDGRTSAVLIGESEDFAFAGLAPFTLEVWLKLDAAPAENLRVVSRRLDDATGTHGYELVVTPSLGVTFNRHAGDALDHLATKPMLSVGRWAHVVAVFDGTRMRAFVDGSLADEIVAEAALDTKAAPLDVGRRAGTSGTSTFGGCLSEVAITARALDAGEVTGRFVAATEPDTVDPSIPGLRVERLWAATVSVLLSEPGWDASTGDHLLIPLHAAFAFGHSAWIDEFAACAVRAQRSHLSGDDRLQELYVWGRFVALAAEGDRRELIPDTLVTTLTDAVVDGWAGSVEPGLDSGQLLLFGLAADLLAARVAPDAAIAQLTDIRDAAVRTFAGSGRWTPAAGWLIAVGAAGTPLDADRAQLLPAVLESLRGSFDAEEPGRRFVDHLRLGLERQFYERMLVPPGKSFPGYRLAGVMDGSDDEPEAALTATDSLFLAWWSRLPGERIRSLYAALSDAFPLSDALVEAYTVDHSRRHPLSTEPAAYTNGLRELLVRLSAAVEPPAGPPPLDP